MTSPAPIFATGATFSPCGTFRYTLTREWSPRHGVCAFVGFNPSTADAFEDDPTIRRCIGFARAWGYGALSMLNLFAHRSTDPREIARQVDPVGPGNDRAIERESRGASRVVVAWGALAAPYPERVGVVLDLLQRAAAGRIVALCEPTRSGQPRHPLYVPASAAVRSIEVER